MDLKYDLLYPYSNQASRFGTKQMMIFHDYHDLIIMIENETAHKSLMTSPKSPIKC